MIFHWKEKKYPSQGGLSDLQEEGANNCPGDHLPTDLRSICFDFLMGDLSSEYLACTLDHCVAHEKVQDDHLELQKRENTQAETNKKHFIENRWKVSFSIST